MIVPCPVMLGLGLGLKAKFCGLGHGLGLGVGIGLRGLALAKNSRPTSWQTTQFTINFYPLEHGDWSELFHSAASTFRYPNASAVWVSPWTAPCRLTAMLTTFARHHFTTSVHYDASGSSSRPTTTQRTLQLLSLV